jgi:hypothetical protein
LIVIPAWNEEQSIDSVLKELKGLHPPSDVLVVDDGSEDGTARIAEEHGVRVINHGQNRGYTAALQSGRMFSLENGYDFTVFIDADGQHRLSDIRQILNPLLEGDADQVRGSRQLGSYEWKEPRYLRIPRRICSFLVSVKTRKIVTDATSGFKAENRTVTEHLKKVYETSKKIHLPRTNDIEEYLLLSKAGVRLMEVPVTMRERSAGMTKCYRPKQLLGFPWDLIRTFIRNL